jgi:hypothetical protein
MDPYQAQTVNDFDRRAIEATTAIGVMWGRNEARSYANVEYVLTHAPAALDAVLASIEENRANRYVWRELFSSSDWKSDPQHKIKYEPEDCTPEEATGGDAIPLINDYLALLPITRRVIERSITNDQVTNTYIRINIDTVSTILLNAGLPRTPQYLQAALLHKFITASGIPEKDLMDCIVSRLDEVEQRLPELRDKTDMSVARLSAILDDRIHSSLYDGAL